MKTARKQPSAVRIEDLPAEQHRALVEAGYAPLGRYVARRERERPPGPPAGRTRNWSCVLTAAFLAATSAFAWAVIAGLLVGAVG